MELKKLFQKAEKSRFQRWKLNFLLQLYIPFNRPHGLKISELSKEMVRVKIPYKRKNFNHIKGLHACVLATAAEFSSGILLSYKLGVKHYRIIMKSLEVDYFYQGKTPAFATFKLSDHEFESTILEPLKKDGVVFVNCEIHCHDQDGNHLCTAKTNWQIKSWEKVQTKT